MRLENKVAVITGGGGGIGRAVSLRMAQEGARIAAVDVAAEQVEETVRLIKEQGGEALAIKADVSRAEEVQGYVSQTVETFGSINVFFNNAGIEGQVVPIPDYPEEVFDKVLAVNIKGIWLGLKYVIPVMQQHGGGSIINTSSVAGLIGFPGFSPYIASKHAVIGLTRTAALEFAKENIRVNAICPGPIHTRMMRSLEEQAVPDDPTGAQKMFEETVPLGRYGEPDEVAQLVLFLASDEASYITGGIYTVDGAATAD
jgi:NAD(P)-dependent dehydrogenase (short-subunit alcohol dehydrogenase family)